LAENGGNQKNKKGSRIIELKLRGLTAADITARMRNEGYSKISERTVERFWATIRKTSGEYPPWSPEMVEELQRQQLADITMVDERELKLKYRDRLLDKLMPRRFEQTLSGGLSQDVKVKQDVSDEQFAKFVPVIADMVMGEQARRANQPHDQEGTSELLDTTDADS